MKEFANIESFIEHLGGLVIAETVAARVALGKCAKVVEKRAKDKIGEYQEQTGPFMAWADLSDATLYGGVSPEGHRYPGKVELGYAPPDNPLLRKGDLRDSISSALSTSSLEAQIGSDSDIAVFQELGTSRMPPRSFLGGAMADELPKIREILEKTLVGVLIGSTPTAALVGEEVVEGGIEIGK